MSAPVRGHRQLVAIKPRQVDRLTWYYEYPGHLLIVREVRGKDGRHIQTEQFKLPWRKIEASRKRRPHPSAARRAG